MHTGSTFINESCIVLLGCNPVTLFRKLVSASKKCGLLTNKGVPKDRIAVFYCFCKAFLPNGSTADKLNTPLRLFG